MSHLAPPPQPLGSPSRRGAGPAGSRTGGRTRRPVLAGATIALMVAGLQSWFEAVDRPSNSSGDWPGLEVVIVGGPLALVASAVALRLCGARSALLHLAALVGALQVVGPLLGRLDPPLFVWALLVGSLVCLTLACEARGDLRRTMGGAR